MPEESAWVSEGGERQVRCSVGWRLYLTVFSLLQIVKLVDCTLDGFGCWWSGLVRLG